MKKLIATFTMLCVAQILCAQSLTPEVLCNASGRITNGTTNIDFATYPVVMFNPYSTNIANNYANMFAIDHVHND